MSKYLFIASAGIAATNAQWAWPMENPAMALNDMDNWTWMALPTEADFPFQGEADWYQMGEWSGNAIQDKVHGWYATEGSWSLGTEFTS